MPTLHVSHGDEPSSHPRSDTENDHGQQIRQVNSTHSEALDRGDSLWRLLGALHSDDFGQTPACIGVDPELFYPLSERSSRVNDAKKICCGCPVRHTCLQFALSRGEQGIWGGTTDSERHQMRLSTRLANPDQPAA